MAANLLVVDDEAHIQDVLEQLFCDAGYQVSTASDGGQAIDLLEQREGSLEALITDLELGQGPSGWDVALRARVLHPRLPIIYITGGSGHRWPPAWAPDGVTMLKPFACDHMVAVVSGLLQAR